MYILIRRPRRLGPLFVACIVGAGISLYAWTPIIRELEKEKREKEKLEKETKLQQSIEPAEKA